MDDIYMAGLPGITGEIPGYAITYTTDVEDMGGYELGTESEFDVNVEFDSWEILDFNTGATVPDVSSFWAQLKESQYDDSPDNRYYIGIQPGEDTPSEGLVYFLLKNGSDYVAIIKLNYEPSGSGGETEDVNLYISMMGEGYEITKLESGSSDRPDGWETQPCFLLTFTGTEAGMAVIEGFPESPDFWNQAESWVEISRMSGTSYSFMFNLAAATGEDGIVSFYDVNYGTALKIVCRVITE